MFRIKYCREIVLKILYQADVTGVPAEEREPLVAGYFQTFRRVSADEEKFVVQMIDLVLSNQKNYDKIITQNLIGWKLSRISPIDRALMRMGLAESEFNDQKAIIIDDIIRMAQKYGEQDSYKFINAILDKVIP